VHSTAELQEATARIADELSHQYLLGYSSSHTPDGRFHSIRVRVRGGEYRVRARNGYVAVTDGRHPPRTIPPPGGDQTRSDR
jgi:hypothetical protein